MAHYMDGFWADRLADCRKGIEVAKANIGRISLIQMDQQRIPLEQYGTEPCRLLAGLGVAIEAALHEEGIPDAG